jgi:uncharacterized membrane protein YhfC
MRLALFVLIIEALWWAMQLPRVSLPVLLLGAPYGAVFSWILYLAFEPYVRRKWPANRFSLFCFFLYSFYEYMTFLIYSVVLTVEGFAKGRSPLLVFFRPSR